MKKSTLAVIMAGAMAGSMLAATTSFAADEKIALITMDSIDQHWISLNEGAQKAAGSRRLSGNPRSGERPGCDLLRTEGSTGSGREDRICGLSGKCRC